MGPSGSGAPKRVFIQNFGCQMNDYDVERMHEVLRDGGYEAVDAPERADLIVLNSCAIREKAEHKVLSAAGRVRELKLERPGLLLAIGGCVATQEGERLLARAPAADLVFGPDQIPILPALLDQVARGPAPGARRRLTVTDFVDVESYRFLDADPQPGGPEQAKVTALVTIQKGCDNHCAYCIVPHTRGREVSRPLGEVVAEVARFVASGAKEITLIGQNVNSYHGAGAPDGDDFAELLRRVDAVPGLVRLRYTTSHPKDFTRKVAEAHRDLRTLGRWLHLPVQAGASRTLRRMVRGYTREEYLAKVGLVRGLVPDLSLSTDIIVGYPGERDEDFRETLTLLEEIQYDFIYSFAYSERPDTPALKLKLRDDVPLQVKEARLQEVQALQRVITARRLARFVGRVEPVLVEGLARHGAGQLCGRLSGNEMVNFPVPAVPRPERLAGELVPVRVTGSGAHTLVGEVAEPPERLASRLAARLAAPPRPVRLPVVTA